MFQGELRHALRSLARQPGYAAAAILSLGLGVGVDTAVFSLVRGVLLRPLPYEEGERLMVLEQHAPGAGLEDVAFSIAELADYRERTRAFEEVVITGPKAAASGGPTASTAGCV